MSSRKVYVVGALLFNTTHDRVLSTDVRVQAYVMRDSHVALFKRLQRRHAAESEQLREVPFRSRRTELQKRVDSTLERIRGISKPVYFDLPGFVFPGEVIPASRVTTARHISERPLRPLVRKEVIDENLRVPAQLL